MISLFEQFGGTYINLITSGKLNSYPTGIDRQAQNWIIDFIIEESWDWYCLQYQFRDI